MRLTIASRKSDLARIQAYSVGDALQAKHPELDIHYHFRESLGDQNQHDPLWQMPEKGVFTEDFSQSLKRNECDIVVHSWKDLPVEEHQDTEIAATLPREDQRDILLLPRQHRDTVVANQTLRVLSSSPRRSYNLPALIAQRVVEPPVNIQFVDVRGNIATRLRKCFDGNDGEALIVAKAAIDRILQADREEFQRGADELRQQLAQCDTFTFPLTVNPTAAAQGALAVEVRRDNHAVKQLLTAINHPQTMASVEQERRHHKALGGGCHQKIGISVFATPHGMVESIRGLSESGQTLAQLTLIKADHSEEPLAPDDPRLQTADTD